MGRSTTALHYHAKRLPLYLILVVVLVFVSFPILLMWMNALKDPSIVATTFNPLSLPDQLSLRGPYLAWTIGNMQRYFLNSVIVAVPRVIGILAIASLAGYGFGKLQFPGRDFLFSFILFGLMLPAQGGIIPLFYAMQRLRLIDTYWAMIIPSFGMMMPFSVFFMRAFFRDLPDELMDSARIDGCNEYDAFRRIMLPLSVPALSTLLVLQFLWSWNDFLLPLLFVYSNKLRTLPLALSFFSVEGFYLDEGMVASAVTITTVPIIIIYIIFQRRFIMGLTAGALKG